MLWRFQTGSGIHSSPVTYSIDGKQYIALMGGSGGTQSPGVTNPGAITTQTKPQLLVFGLNGKAEFSSTGAASTPAAADPHQQ